MTDPFGIAGTAPVVRESRTAGYPLPPDLPGRGYTPTFNGNGQYRLPDPETGKLLSFTRASNVAKTLEDTWMLDAWEKRMMLIGLQRATYLQAELDQRITEHLVTPASAGNLAAELRQPLNSLAEEAMYRAGSKAAAEFGTATHAWCEWVDHGGSIWDVPELFRTAVISHRRELAANGLTAPPEYTERIVLNTKYGVAGTLDRIFVDHTGRLVLGDIKTSRAMDYSWMYFAIQLGIYHGSSHMLSLDGSCWEPMPQLDPHIALVVHIPREAPDTTKVVPISMEFGARALHTAMTVRRMRTQADKRAQTVPYEVGSMTTEQRRWFSARFALETSRTQVEMAEVWERFSDVWDDSLTEIGRKALLSANANANA